MNEKTVTIRLRDLTKSANPFGNVQGKEVFRKLVDFIDEHPSTTVFCVDLSGIEATDASFPRESVISVAKQFRGEKGLFLTGLTDRDIIDNWKYGAIAKEQPLVIWHDEKFEVIGPEISSSTKLLIDYVLSKGSVSTSQVVQDLDMSVQNASTRLKKLVDQGYLLRSEVSADSGGIEYIYQAIK